MFGLVTFDIEELIPAVCVCMTQSVWITKMHLKDEKENTEVYFSRKFTNRTHNEDFFWVFFVISVERCEHKFVFLENLCCAVCFNYHDML